MRGPRGRQAVHPNAAPGDRNKKLRRRAETAEPRRPDSASPREARILRAVIEELARSDYGGLAFDRVAARAGVNKTTVYRHWETKADLVRAALSLVLHNFAPPLSSGALREDLIRVGRRMVEFATSFEGQSLARLHLLQHPEPELASIAKDLHVKHIAQLTALGEAATARGELAGAVDFKLLLDMLGGALHLRIFVKSEPVDDVLISRIVDILLRGVAAAYARSPRRRARKTPIRRKSKLS